MMARMTGPGEDGRTIAAILDSVTPALFAALVTALAAAASASVGLSAAAASGADSHLQQRLSTGTVPPFGTLDAAERRALEALYADGRLLWLAPDGRPTSSANDALRLLATAGDHGLRPADYHVDELDRRAGMLGTGGADADGQAVFDLATSTAMLRYLRHLHNGRVDPQRLGWRLDVPAERHDLVDSLRRALATQRVAALEEELAPALAQYRQLRVALRQYRALTAATASDDLELPATTIRPGDPLAPAHVEALAARLRLLGDLEPGPLPDAAYEAPLVGAVRRFQDRHGLEVDGIIGPATRAALAVPLSWRVRQIELSLERLRWLPDLADTRVIVVNIPTFHLWAWDSPRRDGRPALGMRAIVGRALRTQTPVFIATLREVVFRPYWNIPRSILVNEILPRVARDPGYLARNGMEIVRGWGDDAPVVPATGNNIALLRQGALRLRQRPGPANSLGLVKFMFPNVDNVYLHDTPAHELFSLSRRDFSHGCVRVENPKALAEWVLRDQPGWTREAIEAAMAAGGPTYVLVARPVQVVLYYLTAAVDPSTGIVRFADDIYRHDPPLDRALTIASR